MATRKGDLTGSKRVKQQDENSVGARAKRLVDDAIGSLGNVSEVAAKVVETTAQVGKTVGDIAQTKLTKMKLN